MYVFAMPCRGSGRKNQLTQWLKEGVEWIERQPYIDDYRIIVIEQIDDLPFNLGWNINVGFDLTNRDNSALDYEYSYEHRYVYQPVDCIPQDRPRSIIGIPDQEQRIHVTDGQWQQMSFDDYCVSSSDLIVLLTPLWWQGSCWTSWVSYYKAIITGRGAYEKLNGHSNEYFGWGCEDDDLLLRIELVGDKIVAEHRAMVFDEMVNLEQDHCYDAKTHEPTTNIVWNRARKERNLYSSGLNTLSYEVDSINEFAQHVYLVKVAHGGEHGFSKKWNL